MNIKTLEYIHKMLSEEAENCTRMEMYCEKENARYKQKMHCGECTVEECQQYEKEAREAAERKRAALDALRGFEAQGGWIFQTSEKPRKKPENTKTKKNMLPSMITEQKPHL